MAHPHAHERAAHVARAHKLIGRTGYARGGSVHSDAKEDGRMIERGVGEHESHMHPGKPKTKLHLGDGVEGEKGRTHLAKRARGGATHGKKGHSTKVNVIVAPQGGGGGGMAPPMAARPPMPPPAAPPAAGMMPPGGPPRPPMAPPPGGGMMPPPGAGMMRKRGGKIEKRRANGGQFDADDNDNFRGPFPASSAPKGHLEEEKRPAYYGKGEVGVAKGGRVGRAHGGKIPDQAGGGSGLGRIDKARDYGSGRGFKPKQVPMEARGR